MNNPENKINIFGKTNFRNKQIPFGIKPDDRRRHMYVIGKTGMGKTTLMENMVIQDIRNGHGVCFIDPHGDAVLKILDFVPPHRVNDVIYFNPADLDFPIGFNILESVESRYKHLVASGLMGVFTKIWADQWSSRMAYILNNTILAMLDSPGNTMMGVLRMYVDKKYRKKIVDNIQDPLVKSFWVEEFANYNERYRTEAVAPIQNKVGQFLSSGIIRNIIGQSKSTLDLRDVMDTGKILLLDLSKGKVGEDNSALLGAMIITKLQLAALSRVDIPEEERRDFYLYVDEFQNFVTDSFATILSEARKYRLNLIMGHQYIGQLTPDGNTKVRDAVFGNVGTMVVFRVGAADAEFLETEFEPSFTPTDIVNLPKYHIILKLMINGIASDPFTAASLPVNEDWRIGDRDKVIKVSRERYGKPKQQVEEKISRWMGVEFHEASARSASGEPETEDKEPRPKSKPSNTTEEIPFDKKTTKKIDSSSQSNPAEQNQSGGIKIASDFLERQKKKQSAPKQNKPQNKKQQQPKPKKKPQSKKNDIWDVAQKMKSGSNKKAAENISSVLGKTLSSSDNQNNSHAQKRPVKKTDSKPKKAEQEIKQQSRPQDKTEQQRNESPSEPAMQAGQTYEL